MFLLYPWNLWIYDMAKGTLKMCSIKDLEVESILTTWVAQCNQIGPLGEEYVVSESEAEKQILPCSLQKKHSPSNTLISAQTLI